MGTKHCCHGQCSSDSRKFKKDPKNKIFFIAFPKPHIDPIKCRRWIIACKRENFNETNIKPHTYICSKHFIGENGPTTLNPDPISATQSKASKNRPVRKRSQSKSNAVVAAKKICIDNASFACESSEELGSGECCITETAKTAHDKAGQTNGPCMSDQSTSTCRELSYNYFERRLETKIASLQTHIKTTSFNYEACRLDEEKFVFYTGLNREQFDVLWLFLGDDTKNISTWRGMKQNESRGNRKYSRMLTPQNQIFLMLVRLRTGLLLKDLAYRFGISVSYASKIVITWIMFLYDKFKTLNIFPERETDRSKIPKIFRKFKNIRTVIDGFEIRCQRPQDYREQGNTYSDYKASATHKFLLGMHIRGGVSFLSDAFEGAISDKALFKESGIIPMLQGGDLILADRGFNIADICNEIGCKVIIPPFLFGRKQFTREEVELSRSVASARVHVERIIGRVKGFRLLQKVLPKTLVPIISQLVFVAAMLVNFQEPIVN